MRSPTKEPRDGVVHESELPPYEQDWAALIVVLNRPGFDDAGHEEPAFFVSIDIDSDCSTVEAKTTLLGVRLFFVDRFCAYS